MIRCSSIIFSLNWRSVLPHFYRRLKKNSKPQRQNFYLKFARSRFLFHIAMLHACNIVVKWYMLLSTLLDEIFLTSLTTFWLRQNVGKKILFDWSFTIKSFVFLLLHLTFFRMAYIQSTIDRDTFYNNMTKKNIGIYHYYHSRNWFRYPPYMYYISIISLFEFLKVHTIIFMNV